MALLFDGISVTVEIAFTTTPLATTPTWTDVTAYVRDIPTVQRGRTSEYTDFAPGTCTIVLDNRDRRFDPDYTSSPYNPNVVPMKRLKVTWAIGTSGLVFTGFILGWPQQERQSTDGYVTVSAVDGWRFAANAPLPPSVYQHTVTADDPSMYWPLQDTGTRYDDAGPNDFDLIQQQASFFFDASNVTLAAPVGAAQAVTSSASSTALYSQTGTFDDPRAIELWADITADTGASSISVFASATSYMIARIDYTGIYVDYSNTADNRRLTTFGGFYMAGPTTGLHHLALRADTTNMYLLIDGEVVATEALTVGDTSFTSYTVPRVYVVMNDTASLSHIAVYEDTTTTTNTTLTDHYEPGLHAYGHPYGETGGTRLERACDDAGWSATLRDIDTGQTVQGPYIPNGIRLQEYARQIERSEQGLVFFDVSGNLNFRDRDTLWTTTSSVTFSDDGNTGDPIYTDQVRGSHHDTIRNIVTTNWANGSRIKTDSTSRTNYFDAYETIDAPTIYDTITARNLSAYVLRSRKDPTTRIEQLVVPLRVPGGDNEAAKVLDLEIGDVVTVERTPVGVSPQVVKSLLVQGIHHQISVDQWTVVLYLSPAPTSNTAAPYLTVGDATYGKIGATAGNLIPF